MEILPDTPTMPMIFGCLYPHMRLQDPKIRLFVDHVVRHSKPLFA